MSEVFRDNTISSLKRKRYLSLSLGLDQAFFFRRFAGFDKPDPSTFNFPVSFPSTSSSIPSEHGLICSKGYFLRLQVHPIHMGTALLSTLIVHHNDSSSIASWMWRKKKFAREVVSDISGSDISTDPVATTLYSLCMMESLREI